MLCHWLVSLYALIRKTNSSSDDDDSENDPPRALALHLLRGVFGDARLGPSAYASPVPPALSLADSDWLTLLVCDIALPGFTSPQWTVANASLQLFGNLQLFLVFHSIDALHGSIVSFSQQYLCKF